MDTKKCGAFLKELRREKGLTLQALAEALGVSGRTVSRWETGVNLPDLDLLLELSDFLPNRAARAAGRGAAACGATAAGGAARRSGTRGCRAAPAARGR